MEKTQHSLREERGSRPRPPGGLGNCRRIALWRRLLPLGAALGVFLASRAPGETLRVTTWNLAHDANIPDTSVIREAASILRFLDPDVILLQGVTDWRGCMELSQSLEPGKYGVVVCSTFPGASTDAPAQPQVAIFSKHRAYLTRAESWPSGAPGCGGLAFAAIETGTQRLGFFSCLVGDGGKDAGKALVAAIDSVKGWETNQVQSFVLAASSPEANNAPGRLRRMALNLADAGLVDATESMAPHGNSIAQELWGRQSQTPYCFFAGPQGFPFEPRILASARFQNPPLTCEIELDPDKVSTALDIRAENHRERDARARTTQTNTVLVAIAVTGLGLLLGFWRRYRRRKRAGLWPVPSLGFPERAGRATPRSVIRPIIHVQAPRKKSGSEGAASIQGPKPVLRLQTSTRQPPEPPETEAEAGRAPMTEPALQELAGSAMGKQGAALSDSLEGVDPALRHGVVRDLTRWLKQKFVRKLLTDREQMLQAQHLATRMATTLDSRLARIEAQIQVQNQAYLRRIEELNRELAAAREENRELIRERIAQVKAEMEAARARMLAEANLNNTSLRL